MVNVGLTMGLKLERLINLEFRFWWASPGRDPDLRNRLRRRAKKGWTTFAWAEIQEQQEQDVEVDFGSKLNPGRTLQKFCKDINNFWRSYLDRLNGKKWVSVRSVWTTRSRPNWSNSFWWEVGFFVTFRNWSFLRGREGICCFLGLTKKSSLEIIYRRLSHHEI